MLRARADVFRDHHFAELAESVRACEYAIVDTWWRAILEQRPQVRELRADLREQLIPIIDAIADVLDSGDPTNVHRLIEICPRHGSIRFQQNCSVAELIQDHGVFRWALVTVVEDSIGRRTTIEEAMVLHSAVDVMIEHAVQALVNCQAAELRATAEEELKYLTYLSHDLNNNLQAITHSLDLLKIHISRRLGTHDEISAIDLSHRAIKQTVRGMQRLLQHEQVKNTRAAITEDVELKLFLQQLVRRFEADATAKGLGIVIECDASLHAKTDSELLSLVIQNLLGNAIKFADGGMISIGARKLAGAVRVWVRDQGPGIPLDEQERLFHAFERGSRVRQPGTGLGLTIAWEASKLLHADLQLQSAPGRGTTFSILLHG